MSYEKHLWKAASLANPVFRRRNSKNLLVLAYHGVDDPSRFAAQMDRLLEVRTPVSPAEVLDSVRRQAPLPPASVLVTFDDGLVSVLQNGLPILRERSIPAWLFVVTSLLGTNDAYWWEEVEALIDGGARSSVSAGTPNSSSDVVRQLKLVADSDRRAELSRLRSQAPHVQRDWAQLTHADLSTLEAADIRIGSHTSTHPCLDRCEASTIEHELRESKRVLEDLLEHSVGGFAYPNGNVDGAVRSAVEDAGYEVAFAFDHHLSNNPADDPLMIPRVRVDSTTDLKRFELLISGAHSAIHAALGRR